MIIFRTHKHIDWFTGTPNMKRKMHLFIFDGEPENTNCRHTEICFFYASRKKKQPTKKRRKKKSEKESRELRGETHSH